ncbi:hypothetical protein GGR57DRAFT_504160 [Xylariaceae sp. FL1272]|nr:hypothetical protein GGR57DRAFT_504160 [Xylariaceae sp. FL1272]
MYKTILSLAAAGTITATPLSCRQVIPNYPPSSLSMGFKLIANVTDPSTDLTPSVDGWEFLGIHTGAGLNDAVLSNSYTGEIFYHNGTAEEIRYGYGSVVTDQGANPFPVGIYVQSETEFDSTYPAEHNVHINVGSGTIGVTLSAFPDPYFPLTGPSLGSYVACNRIVPYYGDEWTVVRYAYSEYNEETALFEPVIPEGCTAITLIPQCDVLPDLPKNGSISSHEFASPSRCYDDVASINWPEYGP